MRTPHVTDEEYMIVISADRNGNPTYFGPCTPERAKEIAGRELSQWHSVTLGYLTDPFPNENPQGRA